VGNYQGTFRKLIAWQAAKKLTHEAYRLANQFPHEGIYGLSSQMKRASISIMSNLAEGNQRTGPKDILNFLNIAFSSLTELDCQSEVAFDLGYIKNDQYPILGELINKTAFLIFRLIESKKNPKSLNSPQSPKSPNRGFTLVELLVVVAIVAILSVSSVIGFGYLGNTLKARESAGFLSDIVKQEELKVLRGDFDKAVIHFLSDYLVIEEWPSGAAESLGFVNTTCNTNDYEIHYAASGNLTQKNGDGDVIQVKPVIGSDTGIECPGFLKAKDTEWNFQLTSGDQSSAIIRYVHFNLQRDNIQDPLRLNSNAGAKAVVYAPYGRKRFFDKDGNPKDSLVLQIGNSDEGVSEQVTLQ
jgi:four helix bundle protein